MKSATLVDTSSPYIKLGTKVRKSDSSYGVVKEVLSRSRVRLEDGSDVEVKSLRSVGVHTVTFCSGAFNNYDPIPGAIKEADFIGPGAKVCRNAYDEVIVIPPFRKVREGHKVLYEAK